MSKNHEFLVLKFESFLKFWNFQSVENRNRDGGNSSHACKLEPDNSISIFAKTRLFSVKNEQRVRNHNILLETKLDNDQKTLKWVLFY